MNWILIIYSVLLLVVFLYTPMWGITNYPAYRLIDKLQDSIAKYSHMILGKPLNIKVCHDNLFVFKNILDDCKIFFMLSEGTALGMFRDGKLIVHDDDVDTAIWGYDLERFLRCAKPQLEDNGFIYTHCRENFLSFLRNGEKIDVAVISNGVCEPGRCDCTKLLPHLRNYKQVYINGLAFNLPAQESYYIFLYSKDWRIPKKDKALYGDRS